MIDIEYDPHDELHDNDTVEVDLEYPRDNEVAFLDQLFAYYEKYTYEDLEEDALGS